MNTTQEQIENLLDGAEPNISSISKESRQLSSLVWRSDIDLLEKIEHYEDIINIEVPYGGLIEYEFDRGVYRKQEL